MTTSNHRLYRYGKDLNSHDLFKIIATFLMVIDHIGEYFIPDNIGFRIVGRGAAPLFYFLIGYTGKLHISFSLILYGLILSGNSSFIFSHLYINILITFIFIYYFLVFLPPQRLKPFQIVTFFAVCTIFNGFVYNYFEYGLLGFMFVFSARLLALNRKQGSAWLLFTWIVYFVWECYYFRFYTHKTTMAVFAVVAIVSALCMILYRLRSLYFPTLLRIPGLVISRYSLEIYFFHLLALQIFVISIRIHF